MSGTERSLGTLAIFRRPFFWLIVMATAAFVIVPVATGNVELREGLVLAAIYIVLASNLNLMIGYAGYVNFGSIVFFGLGGYVGVYLISSLHWHPLAASLAAGVIVSTLAMLLGLGILRLRGPYFALATIGVNEAVHAFVSNFAPWGGASGIYISIDSFRSLGGPGTALWVIYFILVIIMGLSLVLAYGIKISKFGLGLLAIGQNEDAAAVLGVPTPLYKAAIYSISAFLPAMAGCFYFFKSAFIQPVDAFDLGLSVEAIVMIMLGGQGTVSGVALGGFLYEEMRGWLLTSDTFSHFQLVISGALLLLVVTFAPGGVMGWIHRRWPLMRELLE